jgi:hypothetical protein
MGGGVYRRTIVWWWGGNKVAHRIEKGKGGDTRARVGGSWVGGFFPSKQQSESTSEIDGLVDGDDRYNLYSPSSSPSIDCVEVVRSITLVFHPSVPGSGSS